MIVAEQKPIDEIKDMVAPYRKLLVLGCGTCVKTCFAGGEDEVATLVSTLRLAFRIARAFGVSVEDVFQYSQPSPDPKADECEK